MRKTKIVCTVGPASSTPAMLEKLIGAGMNVARLNFSHGTQEEHHETIRHIREISAQMQQPVAILQDLAGPKIRIGVIEQDTVHIEAGARFILTSRDVPGSAQEVSLRYKELPHLVEDGDTLLLADGAIELQVESTNEHDIVCKVVIGGQLSSHKGVNLSSRTIDIPILTEKDRADLQFGLEHDVDYIAMSFVRSAKDVQSVLDAIGDEKPRPPLIAKIEKHEALVHMDGILPLVDGIMVARGDLGVEIPIERVPVVQKNLISQANRARKLVITATQMLRSMVDSPRPTRAEVTDVANAVLDGTDAVMLSEETAIGSYPERAVRMMSRVAVDAEQAFPHEDWRAQSMEAKEKRRPEDAVARSACGLATLVGAGAIVTCTSSGSTARLVAKCRPQPPILALTPDEKTWRRLALVWGAMPWRLPSADSTDRMIRDAAQEACASGLVKPGELLVLTAGIPLNQPGTTNMIRVITSGGDPA